MSDLELIASMVQTDAALAAAFQRLAECVKQLSAVVVEQKAQIEALALIQRTGHI